MTDTLGHIICGGLGKLLGWILIWLKDHEYLNVAINLKHDALAARGWPAHEITKFGDMIQRDVHRWYEFAEKRGLDYYYYQPHPDNANQVPLPEPKQWTFVD